MKENNIFLWFTENMGRKKVSVHAAQASFFMLVSCFPFFMFLITLLQYTSIDEAFLINTAQKLVPDSLNGMVAGWLHESYNAASGTVLLSLTAIFALWSGSKGFSGVILGLEEIYDVKEPRGVIARRIHSLLDTLIFSLMLIVSVILLIYGNQIVKFVHRHFPFITNLEVIMFLSRSAIAFFIFSLYFLVLYRYVPNHKSTTLKKELPGAILSAFLWIMFSFVYSIYVDYHNTFSSIYGSLTYIVLIMLWIYGSMLIIFLGALFNQYLKTHQKLRLLKSIRELPGLLLSFLGNKK